MNGSRSLVRALCRRRLVVVVSLIALTVGFVLLASPSAGANDVYGNIGPAPQVPAGGIFGRYPMASYQLDQYFPGIKVGVFSGVDVSGVPPLIAYFIAQIIWLITAFIANAVITIFSFCFSLDLLNGNGSAGSEALTPVSQAVHNIYANTFGTPWLVAAFSLVALWAMWKALVQRRYTETAGALAVSLLYCVIGLGIVLQPQATIAPASTYANRMSTALLSLTSQGNLSSEARAKQAAGDQLFNLLVLQPWTVLEFGGLEHCVTTTGKNTVSVPVRPLGGNPSQETALAGHLESGTELHAGSKTCINNENKYAPHFLAYPFQSKDRNSEYEALEHGNGGDLPSSDPAKGNGSYPLGPADEPAAEAAGKGGQYQRVLLSIVIAVGELGAFLLLGALAIGVILAAILLLLHLAFAPVALVLGVIPGRGHEFFRAWLSRLAGYLLTKVIYSLILAVVLAVCQALADATSNLGWLLAFLLQTAFLWAVLFNRKRLTGDLLAATGGGHAREQANHLQTLYYTTRLYRMARQGRKHTPLPPDDGPLAGGGASSPTPVEEATVDNHEARGVDVPEPGQDYGEPIASSEGGPLPVSDGQEFDPDEEPA
jgi:hypothetical protein